MANKPTPADFSPTVPEFPVIGQYQPIYGKFDLTTYIQGASDYEIMSFLVQCYNATLKGYGDVTQLSKDSVIAYNQLQTWVNTWFNNLDVKQDIDAKLEHMLVDGELAAVIASSDVMNPAIDNYFASEDGNAALSNKTSEKINNMAATGTLTNIVKNTNQVPLTVTQYLNTVEGSEKLSNATAEKINNMAATGTLTNIVKNTNQVPLTVTQYLNTVDGSEKLSNAVTQYLNTVDGSEKLSNATAEKINNMAATGKLGTVISGTTDLQKTTTDWLHDNVTPVGSAVVVDKSLTIEGAAADSKATGNSINSLKDESMAYEIDEKDIKCGCKPADEHSINSEYLFHIKANSTYQIFVTVNRGTYNGRGTFGIRNVSTEERFGNGEFGKKTHALTVVPQTNMYANLFVYFNDPVDISAIDVTFTIFEIEKSALYGQRRIKTAKYENLQFVEYYSGMIAKTDWFFTAKDHYYMLSWKLKKGRISYNGTFGISDGEEATFDKGATEGKAAFKAPKTDNHKFFVYIDGHGDQTVDIEIKDVTGLENLFPIANNVLSLRETNSPFSIYENIEMAVKKDSVTALLSSTGKKVGINPVLNKDFPDPSVIKIGDFYYAFGTGTPCYIYTSPDLIHWSLYSSVFPADFNYKAIFGNDFVNMWANDINIIDGKLVDFIGVDYGDEKKRKLIAMVADSINSAFSYAGVVIDSYYNSQNLNPVDAEYTEANGKSYIIAGSYNGIYIYSYNKNTMKYDGKTKKKIVKEGTNEGSYIYKNGNYYYLFTSNGSYFDYTYKICISRSENIEGPYLNKNGDDVTVEDPTPILYSLQNQPLYGPGHNGEIFVDADNRYYMPMHCHIDGAPSNERHMILMQLKFGSDGWPFFVDHNGDKTENPDVYVLFPKIN